MLLLTAMTCWFPKAQDWPRAGSERTHLRAHATGKGHSCLAPNPRPSCYSGCFNQDFFECPSSYLGVLLFFLLLLFLRTESLCIHLPKSSSRHQSSVPMPGSSLPLYSYQGTMYLLSCLLEASTNQDRILLFCWDAWCVVLCHLLPANPGTFSNLFNCIDMCHTLWQYRGYFVQQLSFVKKMNSPAQSFSALLSLPH